MRSMGISGCVEPISRRRRSQPAASAAAISTAARSPSFPPRANVSTPMKNRPKASAFSAALCQSKRLSERSEYGRAREASTRFATPIGTLTAKSHSQDPSARMAEAMVGPSAAAMDTTRAFSPTPRPSEAWG